MSADWIALASLFVGFVFGYCVAEMLNIFLGIVYSTEYTTRSLRGR